MVSVRWWAGLVLVVGLAVGTAAPAADAATYCAGPGTNGYYGSCDATMAGVREALEAASASPGSDLVLIPDGVYTFDSGLSYSDGGEATNGVSIQGAPRCTRYRCGYVVIRGGPPGGALLSLGGTGGANVFVGGLQLNPNPGATGLVLPPGSDANVLVTQEEGSNAVRMEGTAERPATFSGSVYSKGVAIDAPGHGILRGASLTGDVGALVRGGGFLDIRGGEINAPLGVTGTHARVAGLALNLRDASSGGGPPVGFEATCAGPDSADAEIALTNVTLLGSDAPNSTGARATARGGDGQSCDASVRLNSTAIHGVATALDARGEPGTGADPRDGIARVHARYSAFDPARTTSSGPSEFETSTPGGNVSGDPRFYRDIVWFPYLYWDSPLIDRGDPADPEPWQQEFIRVIHGRRDIGRYEYRFEPPSAGIGVTPDLRVAPHQVVRLTTGAVDNDPGDPVSVRWTLSDGSSSAERVVFREYDRLGSYEERLTLTDGAGLSSQASVTITVARQRVMGLTIEPGAFRPNRRRTGRSRPAATIGYALALRGTARFRIEKAVRARARRASRWVRVPGSFKRHAEAGHSALPWRGWIRGRRLRPGRYRLVATASAGPPRRVRFRILR